MYGLMMHFLFRVCLARLVLACVCLMATPALQAQITAKEIIDRVEAQMRGETQQGVYEMTITRPDWERSMRFAFWAEGTERSFIRIESPAKDRGVSFLKIGREMWNYVPRINRVIKIPPSMMLQSWMGSDFTNDDLARESSEAEDYTHTLLGEEMVDGQEAYKIELRPKPDAPVAWDRIVEWIGKKDFMPLRAEYYNERGERVRTMIFSDVKTFGGHTLPARMELIEDKNPGHTTTLMLLESTFDQRINPSVFTQQNLRKRS